MKAHKYWSLGAFITMIGTVYTGYKGLKSSHKYFALSSLLCMIMSIYTGHKMISGSKKTRKKAEATESLLTPRITAPFSVNKGYLSENPHACFVQPAVLSFG